MIRAKEKILDFRFYFQPMLIAITITTIFLGGWWMWTGGVLVSIITPVLDQVIGDPGLEQPHSGSDAPLYLSCFLMFVLVGCFIVLAGGSYGGDFNLASWLGISVEPQPIFALLGGAYTIGILLPTTGAIGHDFSHRSNRPALFALSQFIFALMLNPNFPIEHVYGHHKNIGTPSDSETARRGEWFWIFLFRAVWLINRNAIRIEQSRKRGLMNRAIFGYSLILGLAMVSILLGGPGGLLWFVITGVIALVSMQLIQYIGHYGLVRVPGRPVRLHHSWEWPHFLSSSLLVNLTRHADHHQAAAKQYWKLRYTGQAPTYPVSPIATLITALLPPLFFAITAAELERWDSECATKEELALLGYATGQHHGVPAG